MGRTFSSVIGIFALAGCASTTPTPLSAAKPAAPEYVYKNQSPTSESDARVIIVRDQGLLGAACRLGFYIDGQVVADLDTKERAEFYVPAGVRILGAGVAASARGICSAPGGDFLRQREAVFSPGQQRSFRMSMTSDGSLDVLPLSP